MGIGLNRAASVFISTPPPLSPRRFLHLTKFFRGWEEKEERRDLQYYCGVVGEQ